MELSCDTDLKIYELLLRSYGLWPYQSKLSRRIMFMIFSTSTLSLMYVYASGLTSDPDVTRNVVLENIVCEIFLSLSIAQFFMIHTKIAKVKFLYDQFMADWDQAADEEEKQLLSEYTRKGRVKASWLGIYTAPAYAIFACMSFGLPFFRETNVNGPIDVFPYYDKRMIINDDYHSLQVFLHSFVSIFLVGVNYYTMCATYVISASHVCGIYAISRHRLQIATKPKINDSADTSTEDEDNHEKTNYEDEVYAQLIKVVTKHNEAIHEVRLIEGVFSNGLVIVQLCALGAVGILIFDIVHNKSDFVQVFRFALIILVFLIYLYFLNWSGQQVLQTSDDLSVSVYLLDWYTVPLKAQKMLIAIMQRSFHPEKLTAGSLWAMTLVNFGWILQGSWSFASVFLTTSK